MKNVYNIDEQMHYKKKKRIQKSLKIIDSHMHFSLGYVYPSLYSEADLLLKMDEIGIEWGIVSLLDVMEFGHHHQAEPLSSLSEYKGAKKLLQLLQSKRLFPLVWVRPRDEKKEDFFSYLENEKHRFYGFKMHPFHSRLSIDNRLWGCYFAVANQWNWPVVIHTAVDEYSRPHLVAHWAEKYPNVKIVLVHMGLYTDHEDAIRIILHYPYVYGDTTWVEEKDIWPILHRCGPEKILFGTDALVGGEKTYDFYQSFIEKVKKFPDIFTLVMHENARRIFSLPIIS